MNPRRASATRGYIMRRIFPPPPLENGCFLLLARRTPSSLTGMRWKRYDSDGDFYLFLFCDAKGVLRMPGVIFYDLCQQTAPSSSSSSKLTSTSEELSVEQHLVFNTRRRVPVCRFSFAKANPLPGIDNYCLSLEREGEPTLKFGTAGRTYCY